MAALAEKDDETVGTELHALGRSHPGTRLASGIDLVLWLAVLFTMPFRPLP